MAAYSLTLAKKRLCIYLLNRGMGYKRMAKVLGLREYATKVLSQRYRRKDPTLRLCEPLVPQESDFLALIETALREPHTSLAALYRRLDLSPERIGAYCAAYEAHEVSPPRKSSARPQRLIKASKAWTEAWLEKVRARPDYAEQAKIWDAKYELICLMDGARKAAGLSQEKLAQRLNTTQPAIARALKGKLTLETFARILDACGFDFKITVSSRLPLDGER